MTEKYRVVKYKSANGTIKEYNYKYNYIKKGSKFDKIKLKYNNIIHNTELSKKERANLLYNSLDENEKKEFTYKQIQNLIYRN